MFIVKCSLITLPAPPPPSPGVKGSVRPSSVSVTGRPRVARGGQSRSLKTARKTTATKSVHPEAAFRHGGHASWPIDARGGKKASVLLSSEGPAVVLKGCEGASPRSLVFRTQHSCVASVSGLGPRPRSGMGARGLQRRPRALRDSARQWAGPQGGRAFVAALPFLSGRFGFISRCGKTGIK